MRERYVLLGLARARADWFSRVGQWATSASIAVLIMALIGAAMWVAFSQVFEDTSTKVQDEVGTIGDGDGGGS